MQIFFHYIQAGNYRILFAQKGILILVVLCYFLISGITKGRLYFTRSDYLVNDFYDQYGGKVTQNTVDYINSLESEIAQAAREYADTRERYENGEISAQELEAYKIRKDALEDTEKALLKIKRHYGYLTRLSEERGIQGWFVNPKQYDYLVGEKGGKAQAKYALYALFCLILLISDVFSYEYRCGIKKLLHTTVGGRKRLFGKKMTGIALLTAAVWLLIYSIQIVDVSKKYGLAYLNAPAQSLEMFESLGVSCPIWLVLLAIYAARLALMLSAACVISCLSARLPLSLCLTVSSVALLVPALEAMLGADILDYISLACPMIMTKNLFSGINPEFVLFFASAALGAICFNFAKSKWCTTI